MRTPVRNLLRIASDLEGSNPLIAYELEKAVLSLAGLKKVRKAAMNPGVKTWEEHVDGMVAVLKSLDAELGGALQKAESFRDLKDLDAISSEFARLFEEMTAEEEQLREFVDNSQKLGKVAASGNTAGVGDFLKGIWKGIKGDKGEPGDEEAGMAPSYTLDEGTMDDFVEGKSEWMDASQYIEEEFAENKDFFGGASDVLAQMDSIRKQAQDATLEIGTVQKLRSKVQQLIRHGQNMLKGIKKHLLEPAPQVTIEDDDEAPVEPDGGGGPSVWDLDSTVEHYVDVLRENLGDEKKLTSLLKELFKKVEPAIAEQRGSLASRRRAQSVVLPVLVRLAHARPHLRSVLLPVIRQATGR
jgi:hypothetical protein